MLTTDRIEKLLDWQKRHGGAGILPAAHALKTLGEMVELAIAAGANPNEIHNTVFAEIRKALDRGEFLNATTPEKMREEVADVLVCLALFTRNFNIDGNSEVDKKLPVLEARKWKPDQSGVLRRPERVMP